MNIKQVKYCFADSDSKNINIKQILTKSQQDFTELEKQISELEKQIKNILNGKIAITDNLLKENQKLTNENIKLSEKIEELEKKLFILVLSTLEPQRKDYNIAIIPPYPKDEFEPNPLVYDTILANLYSALNKIQKRDIRSFIPHYPVKWNNNLMTGSNINIITEFYNKNIKGKFSKQILKELAHDNKLELLIYGIFDGDDYEIGYRLYLFDNETNAMRKISWRNIVWNRNETTLNDDFQIALRILLKDYL